MRLHEFSGVLRVLPSAVRADLMDLHRFVRQVDRSVSGSGSEHAASALGGQVLRLYSGAQSVPDDVAVVRPMVVRHGIPIEPWLDLIAAASIDCRTRRYATFADVLAQCALSADPVGRIALDVFDSRTAYRVALSDRVCTALQLLQHLQGVRRDYLRGWVYLPEEDLRRFGVAEPDLGLYRATPALTALVRYEADRAACWLESGSILVSTLHGRPRLVVSEVVNRGRALLRAFDRQGFDALVDLRAPSNAQIAAQWLRAGLRSAG